MKTKITRKKLQHTIEQAIEPYLFEPNTAGLRKKVKAAVLRALIRVTVTGKDRQLNVLVEPCL